MRGPPALEAVDAVATSRLPVRIAKDGGGSERAQLICGFLGCDARPFNPLLATLPRVIHVPRRQANDGVLHHLIQIAVAGSEAKRAGGECMLARVSELLFIEVVRRHVAALPPENASWLSGLRDESVGRAIGKLHARPAQAWTLEERLSAWAGRPASAAPSRRS